MHGQDLSDLWVPKLVKGRLTQSMKIINAIAGPTGPAGYGASLPRELIEAARRRSPDGEHQWWEFTDDGSTHAPPRWTAARITQAEHEMLWPYHYLGNEPPPRGSDLKPLRVMQVYMFCQLARRVITFDKACRKLRWPRGTAYRAVDRGLAVIAMGLNRDRVPVRV